MFGRVATLKPRLTAEYHVRLLASAQNHKNWTTDNWSRIIWSDESKFELFRTSGRVWIRRKAGEQLQDDCVVQTVPQGGGSIMVWGCMMRNRIGHIALVNDWLNTEKYICILENVLVPTIYEFELGHGDITLMHDSAPAHQAKSVQKWLQHHGSSSLSPWPAQSPDLNPIEYIWDYLVRVVLQQLPHNTSELWKCLKTAWNNVSQERTQTLVDSMITRVSNVIHARGGYTKY